MQKSDDHSTPSEIRQAKLAQRERFLEWCKENGEDTDDEGAWDSFNETDTYWENMDKDNLAGWTDNMNKD